MPQLSINDENFWRVKKRMVELKMSKYDEIISYWLECDGDDDIDKDMVMKIAGFKSSGEDE